MVKAAQSREETEEWNKEEAARTPKRMTTQAQTRKGNLEVVLQMQETQREKWITTAQQAVGRCYPLQFLCDYANAVLDGETGELLEYRHLIQCPKYKDAWNTSFRNKIGRLAQGMPGRVEGTNTIFFIPKASVPADRWKDITYGRIVCNIRDNKVETHRTRLTIGGDRINYPEDCRTPTADLLTVKLLLNSVISTPEAWYMTMDIKNFYLNMPLKCFKYLRRLISG